MIKEYRKQVMHSAIAHYPPSDARSQVLFQLLGGKLTQSQVKSGRMVRVTPSTGQTDCCLRGKFSRSFLQGFVLPWFAAMAVGDAEEKSFFGHRVFEAWRGVEAWEPTAPLFLKPS